VFVSDELVDFDPDTLTDAGLADAVVQVRRAQARLAAAAARLTAALDTRRVWAADGSRSAASWLAYRCRLPASQMHTEVRLARRLPHMPATEEAFSAGEVGGVHAQRLGGLSVGRTAQALELQHRQCFHHSCDIPAQDCHTNGQPACGPHNRSRWRHTHTHHPNAAPHDDDRPP
jgi:hypothetical protein